MAEPKLTPGKGMIIDGIVASELLDSSGEILKVEGCDVSSMETDGTLNVEHVAAGEKGFDSIIGKCVKIKKIFKADDCKTARERFFWDQVEVPFIYGQFRLFDGSGHRGAEAAASVIRDALHANEPPLLNFSIEGSTLQRDGNILVKTIARGCALTARPCNKTALSGVIEDPNGPPLPEQDEIARSLLEDAKKSEGFGRLGGWSGTYHPCISEISLEPVAQKITKAIEALNKTLTAGGGNAAPSTLTGGSALTSENGRQKVRTYVATFKSAVRDYDPATHRDFKEFLKTRMPEASDQFIDKFVEMSDKFGVKQSIFKKKEEPQPAPADTPELKVRPRAEQKGVDFDESRGILHTPKGAFKVYIPHDASYEKALRDPRINKIHDHAMKNWLGLHRLAREGRVPEEIIAHAALFSAMSPNSSIATQELAYGFMQDLARKGFDPTKKYSPEDRKRWESEWRKIEKGQMLPEYMREHYLDPSAGVFTKKGKRQAIGLGDQKIQGALNYSDIHDTIAYLMNHTKGDARQTSGIINKMKALAETKRGEGLPKVTSFAPKTIRYLLGMSGGGNTVVPDTHFIRHTFGLPLSDDRSDTLKSYLWDARNEDALAALDRYYYTHHPAVKSTQEYFRRHHGEELGENAIFPAFWKHWLTIQPHEESRGWQSRAQNADTDHEVYWRTVKRILDKYAIPHDGIVKKMEEGVHAASLAARTAHAQRELADLVGDTGATIAYYAYMVPALRGVPQILHKTLEAIRYLRELTKEESKTIKFKGHAVTPGEVEVMAGPHQGKTLPLVFADKDWHYVVPSKGAVPQKISNQGLGSAFKVTKPHQAVHLEHTYTSRDGLPGLCEGPEQIEMLDGLDIRDTKKRADRFDIESYRFVPHPSDPTQKVFLKSEWRDGSAAKDAAFYVLARDIFGLGEHVPVTAAFRDRDGQIWHAQKAVGDNHHPPIDLINRLGHQGVLHKLALMDLVLMGGDRHLANTMWAKHDAPHIHLIDNEYWGDPDKWAKGHEERLPDYVYRYDGGNKPLHGVARDWFEKLDPEALDRKLKSLPIDDKHRTAVVRRLRSMQSIVRQDPNTSLKDLI